MSEKRGAKRPADDGGFRGGPMGPMSRPVDKAKDFKGTLKRLLSYLRPRRFRILAVILFAVLSTVFSIVSPKIMGKATTQLFEDFLLKMNHVPGAAVDFDYIFNLLLILAGLYLVSAFFAYVQQYVMSSVAQHTVYDMRRDVNAKLSRLPLKFFDATTHGEILSRVTNDIDNISTTLQQSLTQLITSVVTLLGVFIMMLTISPWLTLIYLAILPLSALVTKAAASRSQRYFAGQQKALGELNGHVEEMYTGHQVVKAFGHEQKSVETFNGINRRLYEAGWKAQFISGMIMPLLTFINNIGYVLVSIVGGIFVSNGVIPIGDLQAFIQYSRQFTHPIVQTANIVNIIQSTIASAERVFEVLDEAEEIPDRQDAKKIIFSPHEPKFLDQTKETVFATGEIRFEEVAFSYQQDVSLIEHMNIDVKPGQTIAIVGPTGAGKTTLVNLLMRFYEIDSGRITVDGVDIRKLKRGDLRSIFGMVLQDAWLFNGAIKENIAYGREGASEEEIIRAARAAHADHFIRTLPAGYNTVLNEEASNISQGQKQLLTIARAILADPAILILDEATSNVDTRTEILIQKAMSVLMWKRTSFIIAHRLSTIRDADLILVMNEGSVIEKGSHTELLAGGGFYADLYNSQFTGANRADRAG